MWEFKRFKHIEQSGIWNGCIPAWLAAEILPVYRNFYGTIVGMYRGNPGPGNPSSSLDYPTPYGIKTSCPHTYNLAPQSGAKTGLFFHQGLVVNTKMEPFCPPRKLSPRFGAKFQNRSNCGALYFPFSGVLEGVFFWSNFVLSGTRSGPRRPLLARIWIGGGQENLGLLIQSEMREVLNPENPAVLPAPGISIKPRAFQNLKVTKSLI